MQEKFTAVGGSKLKQLSGKLNIAKLTTLSIAIKPYFE